MPNVTQFEPVIGRSLRERYEAPTELPSKLLALVRKLEADQANSPGQETRRSRGQRLWMHIAVI